MTTRRPIVPRPRRRAVPAVSILLAVVACSTAEVAPSPEPSRSTAASVLPPATAAPTPSPSPTPSPTPRFTNEPDAELAALIPEAVNGIPVSVAPVEEVALTPGDVGLAYGDVGARFASLVVAYVEQPRLTLYAMRVDGEPVATQDLEPYLASAGRYVGIAGLDPQPWELTAVGGHQVWSRPEDDATAAGTTISTWSSGEYVFLLIGVDDALNNALIAALPGEPVPSPTPTERPPASPGGSASPDA